MTDELLKIVLLLSVGQGITFSLLLIFKKKGDRWANGILATFMIFTSVPLWNEYISLLPQSLNVLILHPKLFYIPMLYGPLLYLYTLRYTRAEPPSVISRLLLLAGPVYGSVFVIIHFYGSQSGLGKFTWYLFYLSIDVQIAACLFACWMRLKQHNQDIKQNLSNLEKSKLDWLKLLIYSYLGLLALYVVQTTVKLFDLPIFDLMHLSISIADAVFIFFVGLWGISKPEIHFEQVLVKANRKYDNSTLSNEKAGEIVNQLQRLMESEELYLDNEISLVSLSEQLQVSPHHLSQALNQQLEQNFYDYINSARIERAKAMLSSKGFQKVAIIDVAYQVGFNNKTSFNNAFKKYTQLTPSQFRAKIAA